MSFYDRPRLLHDLLHQFGRADDHDIAALVEDKVHNLEVNRVTDGTIITIGLICIFSLRCQTVPSIPRL